MNATQTGLLAGLILGAALAAGLAGKFAPKAALPVLSLLAAAIGGVLMGYGARPNNVFVLLSALEQLFAEQKHKFEHGASIAAATAVYSQGK